MFLSCERYEEIKTVVVSTLQQSGIVNLPICCFQLANSLAIQCIAYSSLPLKKQLACLEFSDEGFTLDNTIYYNDAQIDARTRFTIMHEIGHIMLGHTTDDERSKSEANFFAKYILAPPVLIHAYDRAGDICVEQIKKIFNVSQPVAEYAYEYYQKWMQSQSFTFGFSEIDATLYNHFLYFISNLNA